MGRRGSAPEGTPKYELPPAETEEAVENIMINAAMNLAYQRLMDGTASSAEVVHFLKLGSTNARIEKEILEKQKDLIEAKTDAIHDSKKIEELYSEAIKSMRVYSGQATDEDEEDEN
ncbi:MAG: hypothetical protein KBT27_03430 [Prevotellaceae bacterium]|nr:hypothetical protein [Candidatus Faecinaster equi]